MSETAAENGAGANLEAARRLLDALVGQGVMRLVLCPGSRSGPLAAAAGLLARRGLSLHTAIDERSAAFFALGLSRGDGVPAVVITTSGTAVANLLPAVVEADSGAIPLLLLTADRPARLKGCGANQTVNQEAFLAPCCRWFGQGDGRGLAAMQAGELEALARRAWQAAGGSPAGPVHLNLPFEEPLHAGSSAPARPGPGVAPAAAVALASGTPSPAEPPCDDPLLGLEPDRPGVIVAGPWRGRLEALPHCAAALQRWQGRCGWPLLADGLSGLRGRAGLELVAGYDLILEAAPADLAVTQVLRLGPMPASRRLQRWLGSQTGHQVLISEADPRNQDPLGTAAIRQGAGLAAWCASLPDGLWEGGPSQASLALKRRWRAAEARVQEQLTTALQPDDEAHSAASTSEPALARALSRLLPGDLPLMLASSSPVRDWESFADPAGPARAVLGFRGASGIDGTLSLAAGLAESLGRLVLLTGDLALLHDANGWLWRRQLGGRLTVVLIDNGGGGIFEQLPIRAESGTTSDDILDFERLFAMPQELDHCRLATVHGVPSRRLERLAQLEEALRWALAQPVALLELRTDRRADAALRQRLRSALGEQDRRMAAPLPQPR